MPGTQSQGRAASMQPLGTIKNKKGHHPNTPPLWETSRAQHCQAKRYSWAKCIVVEPVRKKFTILHSNDIHGDFQAEVVDGQAGQMLGGLAHLSGYINKVRKEEKNALYLIAGDMVQGSMIDTEYKGVSTMELMNYLSPDAATIGNHELNYGLYHLLFLEKLANFPIVVSNLYLKKFNKRLMKPYLILNVDGFDILIIGIITETIMAKLKTDENIGSFISLEDARNEVGRICNAYKDDDIDLTILLTHIGFEEDKELAAMLDPAWGVDIIIGGHSHTILEQPETVNNILVTQAGVGTDQIGRFDIVVDDETNSIVEWKWQLLPVDEHLAPPDEKLQAYIDSFQDVVDRKYNTIICRFAQELTHPTRDVETALGNLFADILAKQTQTDLVLLSSVAIRSDKLGPLVTLGNFTEAFPYPQPIHRVTLSGEQLKHLFNFSLEKENRTEGLFQVNKGVKMVYNESTHSLESLTLNGQPIEGEKTYTVCVQDYFYNSSADKFGIPKEDLIARGTNVLATSISDVLEEHLRHHQNLDSRVEGRIVFE
jgi:5'-nucleotidase